MRNLAVLTAGVAAGIVTAATLDPSSGRRRRALIRDKATHYNKITVGYAGKAVRDFSNRTRGMIARPHVPRIRRRPSPGELLGLGILGMAFFLLAGVSRELSGPELKEEDSSESLPAMEAA